MVKFIHTADWHIGMKANQLGSVAEKVRERRWATIEKIMKLARDESVDLVIVAGDIFEDNSISKEVTGQLPEILSRYPEIPVYILPGNHDPLVSGCVYDHPGWEKAGNVTVLRGKDPVEFSEEVLLYPAPVTQKRSAADPTEHIDAGDEDRISVGIAHGALDLGMSDDPNFPIAPDRPEKGNLDYLALGEWHSWLVHGDPDEPPLAVYPGSPEATKFGEKETGNVALVEIDPDSRRMEIEKIPVGSLHWEEDKPQVSDMDSVKDIEHAIKSLTEPGNTILRLKPEGVVPVEVFNALEELVRREGGGLLYFDLDLNDVLLKPSFDDLMGVIPREMTDIVRDLQALMSRDPRMEVGSETDRKELSERQRTLRESDELEIPEDDRIAQEALLLLYRFSREVDE